MSRLMNAADEYIPEEERTPIEGKLMMPSIRDQKKERAQKFCAYEDKSSNLRLL